MALHHVRSMENWERTSPNDLASALEPRRMSFSPLENTVVPPPDVKPLPAVEVSRVKRIAQIVISCIYCLFAAGVVFGFAAFKPVLVKEGVYSELCFGTTPHDGGKTCVAQEIRLNLMFATAAVVTNVAALPVGIILDRYGPRVCGVTGAFFLAFGSASMILAPELPLDGYLLGYVFLALGGPFIYISSFQLSNCFPRFSGLILALLTGAFDTSSAILLIYRVTYEASGDTFSPQNFFTVYLVVPVAILVAQVFIMPAHSYEVNGKNTRADETTANADLLRASSASGNEEPTNLEHSVNERGETLPSETTPLIGDVDRTEVRGQEERKERASGVWGVLHGLPAAQQIQTPWWILITLFTMFQMTRINYFVATIRTQYSYLLQSYEKAIQINNFFDILLPIGGIVSIPFIGLILDNLSTPATLSVLVGIATVIGILGVLPYMWAAYFNVVLFTLNRPLYYTGISDFTAKVFGFNTFGKVYGLIICLAGLVNFVQSGLDALTHGTFQDDPVPVNILLLCLVFTVGATLVLYVQRQQKLLQQNRMLDPADH